MTRQLALLWCPPRPPALARDPAWLPWRGTTLLQHLCHVLAEAVDEVVVVAGRAQRVPPLAAPFALRRRLPTRARLHALAPAQRSLIVPCDMPQLDATRVRTCAGRRAVCDLREAAPSAGGTPPGHAHFARIRCGDDYLRAVREDSRAARAAGSDAAAPQARLEFVGRARRLAGTDAIAVPIGSLAQVLSHAPAPLALCRGDRVAAPFLVSLGGRDFIRDARAPVGPGERVIVLDSSAGG